jgi:hypothetical protein
MPGRVESEGVGQQPGCRHWTRALLCLPAAPSLDTLAFVTARLRQPLVRVEGRIEETA